MNQFENGLLNPEPRPITCYLQEEDPPEDHDLHRYSAVCGKCYVAAVELMDQAEDRALHLAEENERLTAINAALVEVCELAIESHYAPDPNCSCHISPPCSDCVEYSGIRETVAHLREELAKARGNP